MHFGWRRYWLKVVRQRPKLRRHRAAVNGAEARRHGSREDVHLSFFRNVGAIPLYLWCVLVSVDGQARGVCGTVTILDLVVETLVVGLGC